MRIAGQLDDDALEAARGRYAAKDPDRSTQVALVTAGAALERAGLPVDGSQRLPFDTVVASGHGEAEQAQQEPEHHHQPEQHQLTLR